ncbi:MAG TPA: alpha/beta hydrolase [Gaiellaceae bacterium]
MAECSYAVIAGAGSAGLTWSEVAAELEASVLPIPDEPSPPAMAAALESAVAALPRPRVLVAASMGAIVALELARTVEVDALVLAAAGYGIDVSDRLLDWMIADPPGLFEKMARICVADKHDRARIDAVVEDYVAGGHAVHVRHLQALAGYRPEPPSDPPPTIVLWGVHDPAVPLERHLELAAKCRGALVPIADAAHVPFLEQPRVTLEWIRRAAVLAQATRAWSAA